MNKKEPTDYFVWGFTIFQMIFCIGLVVAVYKLAVLKGVL